KMPSEFTLVPAPLVGSPPEVPPGLPSTLLERRPDIAAARYAMEAANARIGVARTAFFPVISLTASGGYAATEMDQLFKWSSRAWAIGQTAGAAIAMPIFDSGRNLSRLDAAWAAYEESVSNYRQSVLVAFRDVEDNLSDQRLIAAQSQSQDAAAAAAARTMEVVQTRYDEGDIDFFEVVNTQRDSLLAERAAVQLRGQRFLTAIALVRALGGGWDFAASQKMAEAAPTAPEPVALPAAPKAEKKAAKTKSKKAKKAAKKKAAPLPPMFEKATAPAAEQPAPAPIPTAPQTPAEQAFEKSVQAPLTEEAPPPASTYPGQNKRPSFSTELNTN
ncbi:MAG: TolC family protein, partial [Rickettsiales bacterium]|nr:TolC family protein [Rickettsiales bacterium]